MCSAKVNISPQHASIIESSKFWPEGVTCRKCHSVREWSKICNERTSEENGDSQLMSLKKKNYLCTLLPTAMLLSFLLYLLQLLMFNLLTWIVRGIISSTLPVCAMLDKSNCDVAIISELNCNKFSANYFVSIHPE